MFGLQLSDQHTRRNMKVNRNTVLVGSKVVLVPYRKQHVPRYHAWMKDPLIQEQTASEPLSLEQEYEMQQSWAVDEDKLTFIVLARAETLDDEGQGVEAMVSKGTMVGDVNIFFNQRHEDEDQDEEEQTAAAEAQRAVDAVFDAECEIMIAEHSYRRQGIAREALQMMISFVTSDPTPAAQAESSVVVDSSTATAAPGQIESTHCSLPIPSEWLTCKISLTNEPSIKLFESLGFTRHKVSEVWQEVEMRFTSKTPAVLQQCHGSIRQVLFWPQPQE